MTAHDTPAPIVPAERLVEAALRDADMVSEAIAAGKRIPRGQTEDLRNHVRKLAAALRAQAAKDKARIERLEAALRPFVAYVHYAFHEGNSRFRLVEDFDEGGGWLGSEDFRRARAALEDGE